MLHGSRFLTRKKLDNTESRSRGVINNGPLISAIVAITLAISGYIVAWYQGIVTEQYKARLARVDMQLREFYGPLFSRTESENRAFIEFSASTRPGHKYFWDEVSPPTTKQQILWRRWIESVSMPNYLAMEEIIQKKADLIEDNDIPQPLLDLSAHIAGYKYVVASWHAGDTDRQFSFLPFPQNARDHLRLRYMQLKKEQAELMTKVFR